MWIFALLSCVDSASLTWEGACEGVEDGGRDQTNLSVTIDNDFDGLMCMSRDGYTDTPEVDAYLRTDEIECIEQGGSYDYELRVATDCPAPRSVRIELEGIYCISTVSCEDPEIVQVVEVRIR